MYNTEDSSLLECDRVTGQVVLDILKDCGTLIFLIFSVKLSVHLGVLEPEDEGIMILQHVGNHSHTNTV
jgi:hypothetical protein